MFYIVLINRIFWLFGVQTTRRFPWVIYKSHIYLPEKTVLSLVAAVAV